MTYTMNDAAYFSTDMLGADAVAGYIGGPDAVRAWTPGEWARCGSKPKLPTWVPKLNGDVGDVNADLEQILLISVDYVWPAGQVIAFDLEKSGANYSYMARMALCLEYFNGFGTLCYGSLDTLGFAAPPSLWKWTGDWTDNPHITPGAQATQWTNGQQFDQSVISDSLFDRLVWR